MAEGDLTLIAWAAACIAVMVGLIAWLRLSAFLALIIAALALGLLAGLDAATTIAALQKGFGDILGSIGLIVVLGAVLGSLIAGGGGADRIALIVTNWKKPMSVAWGMVGVALLIGLPMFFESGLAILMPIILRIAQRLELAQKGDKYLLVAMPVLAGLSVAHGLLPPHPGPLAAIGALGADLGLVMILGLFVALPSAIFAGPLYTKFMWTRAQSNPVMPQTPTPDVKDLPSLGLTVFVLFLPVLLIGGGALANVFGDPNAPLVHAIVLLGQPIIALLISSAVAFLCLGVLRGRGFNVMAEDVAVGAAGIAIILLIIGAGGSLKEMLIQTGVSDAIGRAATMMNVSAILLGWLVAATMRVAVGSATVATVTAASLIAPLAVALSPIDKALTVLSIGAGSIIFSHVNNSGFWMVREYLGMAIKDTFKTWSALETIIAVVSLIVILALSWALSGVAI
jgi:GntP family gluconate:H+ symporter